METLTLIIAATDGHGEIAVETLLIGLLVTFLVALFVWVALARMAKVSWAGEAVGGVVLVGSILTLINAL